MWRASVLAFAAFGSAASAQTTTWTGAVSGTWQVAGNWTAGIPNTSTDAVVPAVATPPSVFLGNGGCRDLTIEAGGSLTVFGFELAVLGDVDLDGELTQDAGSRLVVTGDWTNDGAYTSGGGEVAFVGTGTLGGSATTAFGDLAVDGGTRTSTSAWVVDGDAAVGAGATLALGAFTHTVSGDLVVEAGASVTGASGTLQLTGTGTLATGGGGVPNVLVSRGVRSCDDATITGSLTMTGGQFVVLDGATVAVLGEASLSDGTLGWSSTAAGDETLDVEGDVLLDLSAGATSPTAVLRCAGRFTSTSAFTPSNGVVVLDGAGASTIEGAPDLHELRVASGTRTASVPLALDALVVDSGATLVTDDAATVAGDVTLGDATALWSAGAATHTIAGDLVSSGADVVGSGLLAFSGSGALAGLAGPFSVPDVRVDQGVRLLFDVTVEGDLVMTGGELQVLDDALVTVTGDLQLDDGVLQFIDTTGGFETLHVDGDVTILASSGATSVSTLVECAGDWTSGPAFTPAAGTVALVGPATRTVDGPVFPSLRMAAGDTTIVSPALVGNNLVVLAGAALTTTTPLDVEGDVSLGGASATWTLGGQDHAVAGDWLGSGTDVPGPGTLTFDGTGVLRTGSGSVPDVVVAAGTRTIESGTLGSLTLLDGTVSIADGALAQVTGDAQLLGGTLAWPSVSDGMPDQLHVDGAATVTAAAGTTSSDARLVVDGDWTSDATFAPAAGVVVLDGGPASIGGTAPTFPTLRVSGTGKTLTAPATVGEDLVVTTGADLSVQAALAIADRLELADGAALTTSAPLDVDGGVELPGTAVTFELGDELRLGGDWTSLGASATGAGAVLCDATGTLTTGGGALPALVVEAGARLVVGAVVTGDLTMTGGALRLLDDATLDVGGDALLTGGLLEWLPQAVGGDEVLAVAGDVTITTGIGAASDQSRLRVGGDWTSDAAFAPATGRVELVDAVTATVTGPAAFADLAVLGGDRTLEDAVSVGGALDVAAGTALHLTTLDLPVGGPLTVEGQLDLGARDVLVDADATASAPGASVTGTGRLVLTGTGTLASGSNALPGVLVTGGTRSVLGTSVAGDLAMTGGTLAVQEGATLSVAGALDLDAGVLAFEDAGAALEVVDVEGTVSIDAAAGQAGPDARLLCAGDVVLGAAFAPADGRLVLDGAGAAALSGVPTLASLQVAGPGKTLLDAATLGGELLVDGGADLTLSASLDVSQGVVLSPGAQLVTDAPLAVGTDLLVDDGASLSGTAALDVEGDVVLGDATASWDLGGLTHAVGGDWTSAGGAASAGTVDFTADGTVSGGGGSLPDVVVSGGTRTLQDAVVDGALDVQGGDVLVADDATVPVAGALSVAEDASLGFVGGAPGDETLDVEGAVTWLGAAGPTTAASVIRCAGAWTSGDAFAPAAGRVVLDADEAVVLAAAARGESPTFAALELAAPTTTPGGDLDVVAQSILVQAGATLAVGDLALGLLAATLDVQGDLTLGAGGELALAATTAATFAPDGRLRVVGALDDPAVVTGRDGGGYALVVEGRLEAEHFVFERMGPGGVVVTAAATLGTPPEDLRAGTFDLGSSALGAVLLDLERTAPTDLRYLAFEDAEAAMPANVRVEEGAAVTLTNATGVLAGEAFEDDPLDLVSWPSESTVVDTLTATPALLAATVEWTTSAEVDVDAFLLERGLSPDGPFTQIAELAPAGPGPYAFADVVPAGDTYRWRLLERLTHGAVALLDEVDATPWGPELPDNVVEVGPDAPFATIDDALAAIGGLVNPIVLVRPGDYPPFTVTPGFLGALRIVGDGRGGVLVGAAAAQPVEILDLALADAVELHDLQIGDGTGTTDALVVRDCAGHVVLDEVAVAGGGQVGVRVDASTRVAIQRSDVSGAPGLVLQGGALAIAGGGSLDAVDLSGASSLRVAGLSPAATVEAGSTFTELPGVHADVDVPTLAALGAPFTLTLSGEPSGSWSLILGIVHGWIDLPGQKWEMVGLVDFTPFGILLTGAFGPSGELSLPLALPPDPTILGVPILLQTLVQNPATSGLRWSNVASLVPMPE